MIIWYRTREQVPEQVPEGKGYNQVLSMEEDGYAHLGTTPHPDSVKWCYVKQIQSASVLERNDCGHSEDIQIALKGWVARDKSGEIRLYRTEPNRSTKADVWDALIYDELLIDKTVFPNLTWEDEPVEVEVSITRTTNKD